jgi:HD-GYP domain-containing protein (c-di-GMP phosphodiesterase class II)
MFSPTASIAPPRISGNSPTSEQIASLVTSLRQSFGAEFALWDVETGDLVHRPEDPIGDELCIATTLKSVAEKDLPEIVAESGAVCVLALPLSLTAEQTLVATAPFVVSDVQQLDSVELHRLLGLTDREYHQWQRRQTIYPVNVLLKLAAAIKDKLQAESKVRQLSNEIELVSSNLATTYEEISLLYAVTQNLRISSTDDELGRLSIEWLGECLPAKSFAVIYLPTDSDGEGSYKAHAATLFITGGEPVLDEEEFTRLIEVLKIDLSAGPYVANDRVTELPDWQFPNIRQLILVPLLEGRNVFGWIAAINQSDNEEFGTVEASLLGSLGTLLGIHSGNRELYRQQSDLLANIVRALVSAIDAKDPYTSGHSDRVARFAVRIGLELRCNPRLLNTIYMAGLLHDVGKIGIDDNVLRKAGHLTDVEFEHIKRHPELGYRILADLKPLADVLPAVLHHHEQWDGGGYPYGLAGDSIPRIARILAVADAYDAMTSDRPYRRGMAEDKVEEIFRKGAGKFWDPEVIDAFFKSRDEILAIARRERPQVDSLSQQFV